MKKIQNRNPNPKSPSFDSSTSRLEFSGLLTVLSSRSARNISEVLALSTWLDHNRYRYLPTWRRGMANDRPNRREGRRARSRGPRGGNDPVPLILRILQEGRTNGQSLPRPLFPPFASQWPRFLPLPCSPTCSLFPTCRPFSLSFSLSLLYLGR